MHTFERKLLLAASSAIILLCAYPPLNWWWCAFVAFIPFLYALRGVSPLHGWWLAYGAGVVFFLGSVYWIMHVSFFGCIFVITVSSLFWGLFGVAAVYAVRVIERIPGTVRAAVFLSSLWVSIEWLRATKAVFSFGWMCLGYSQTENIPFLQIADMIGGYGISWVIMFINVLGYAAVMVLGKHTRRFIGYFVLICCLAGAAYWYGALRMNVAPSGPALRVGVVQGNIPQDEKWSPAVKERIVETYAKLIEFLSFDAPDLMVLPEASYPGDFMREFPGSSWQTVIAAKQIPSLIGAIRLRSREEGAWDEFNSAVFVRPDGTIASWYDKMMLVPFGEYVPLKPLFSLIGLTKLAYSLGVGDFRRGSDYTVFRHEIPVRGTVAFSSLICFEDIFPELARKFIANGAQFLVVITNDAWFGKTMAPYQHLQASVLRAVENNCYVIRAANTGISGFVSPRGEVLNTVRDKNGDATFVAGGLSRVIFAGPAPTLFGKGGYLLPYGCIAVVLVTIGVMVRSNLRK